MLNGGTESNDILEATINVITPFLVDGLLTDNWDPYYDALYKEISDLFANSLLDKNGNAEPGSGLQQKHITYVTNCMNNDRANKNGLYAAWAYEYLYDWRLDPWENADGLNEYIKGVKKSTGYDKVALMASCIGTNVAFSYIQKYGTDDVSFVGFDISVSGGAEILSDPISGKFNLDSEAINRFIADCDAIGLFSVESFIQQTIDLVAKIGLVEMLGEGVKETIYEKLVHGVTSALALSTFYTFPSYWGAVKAEDFEDAKNYVFGPEGSEKREEYAGLIAKLDFYHENVRTQIPDILKKIDEDENTDLAIIAKYGFQIAPIVEDTSVIGDQFSSLTNASYGATTSTIYGTLSDEYIAQRVSEGKGKYISPDKQVDTSTCLYPDYTWIIKGASHSRYTAAEEGIFMKMASVGKQLTVDDFKISQFIVYDYETDTCSKMTEENCDIYNWKAQNPEDDKKNENIFRMILSLLNWLVELFKKFFSL